MATYMTHPLHGTHIAYSQLEIDSCFAHGWKLKEDEPQKEAPKKEEIPIAIEPPKRGRPKAK